MSRTYSLRIAASVCPRFIYNQGQIEIMSPSAEHEQVKETTTLLANIMAEETRANVEGFGWRMLGYRKYGAMTADGCLFFICMRQYTLSTRRVRCCKASPLQV